MLHMYNMYIYIYIYIYTHVQVTSWYSSPCSLAKGTKSLSIDNVALHVNEGTVTETILR